MPWLDLGEIPTTHSFMRTESEQNYYVPVNANPDHIFVKYSMFRPQYVSSDPVKRFNESSLPSREVTYDEFTRTINTCSELMRNYRGRILMYELGGYAAILIGLLLIIILGIVTSS